MLANVKVPSIPTSAACCDDVQLTKLMRIPFPTPFTTVNYFIGLRPPNTATCSLFTTVNYFIGLRPPNTDTSSYLQLSTTSSDCVLLNRYLYIYLQPSITSSDCVLLQAADVGILGTFTFASIIPPCSLLLQASSHLVPLLLQASSHLVLLLLQALSHLVPLLLQESSLHFLVFFIKTFLLYLFLLLF